MVDRAEVDLDGVHDKRMVDRAQNVKLSLSIIFIARLQRDRFHRELDLVVVALLHELDNTVLAGAKRFAHIVQFEDFLRLENARKARQRLRKVHSSLATNVIKHVSRPVLETIVLGGDEGGLTGTI